MGDEYMRERERERENIPWEERESSTASNHIGDRFPRWSFIFMIMVGHFGFCYWRSCGAATELITRRRIQISIIDIKLLRSGSPESFSFLPVGAATAPVAHCTLALLTQ